VTEFAEGRRVSEKPEMRQDESKEHGNRSKVRRTRNGRVNEALESKGKGTVKETKERGRKGQIN
jgi:hypothetical protein